MAEIDVLKLLREDLETIPYRKSLNQITGSVTATILLQQAIYRGIDKNTGEAKEFYKFKEPCDHKLYKEGDSWCEELGFTREEFDTALKKIGFKRGNAPKGQIPQSEEEAFIIYFTDSSRVTKYSVNPTLLRKELFPLYYYYTKTTTERESNSPNNEEKEEQTNKQTINEEKFSEWKKKKTTNKVKKQVKKQYGGSIPHWVDLDEEVEKEEKKNPTPEFTLEISDEYRKLCKDLSDDRNALHIPTPEGQALFQRFRDDGWDVPRIKCACRIAYTTDSYWRKNFTPALFFRRKSAQSGDVVNNVEKFFNTRADSDPTIYRIKQQCKVEVENEEKK
jgi:hypothetical protein